MEALRSRGFTLAAALVGLSALSLLLPSVPTTDPWGWIVWGREVAHLDLYTAIGGSPAWKPLPVLFTTPYSLAGQSVAPALWLITARAAALASLLVVFRVGSRLGGRAAGVAAALVLPLSGDFVRGLVHGYSEPMMIGLTLGAVDRHMAGRRGQALGLLFLAALGRPEGFAFLLGYGAFAAWHDRRLRMPAAVLATIVPVLWLGGDWWGSGDPFYAARVASALSRTGDGLQVAKLIPVLGLPLLALAVLGCVLAWRAGRRAPAALGGFALAWLACVVIPVMNGSAASNRFLAPVVAVVCVLAGVGAVQLARAARRARPAVAVALIALAAFLALGRAPGLGAQLRQVVVDTQAEHLITHSAIALGQARGTCGNYAMPASYGWSEGALAWALRVPLDRTAVMHLRRGASDRFPAALDFSRSQGPVYSMPPALGQSVTVIGPYRRQPASVGEQRLRVRSVGAIGGWHAYNVRRPGAPRCSGA